MIHLWLNFPRRVVSYPLKYPKLWRKWELRMKTICMGKKKQGTKLVFSPKSMVINGISPPVLKIVFHVSPFLLMFFLELSLVRIRSLQIFSNWHLASWNEWYPIFPLYGYTQKWGWNKDHSVKLGPKDRATF